MLLKQNVAAKTDSNEQSFAKSKREADEIAISATYHLALKQLVRVLQGADIAPKQKPRKEPYTFD